MWGINSLATRPQPAAWPPSLSSYDPTTIHTRHPMTPHFTGNVPSPLLPFIPTPLTGTGKNSANVTDAAATSVHGTNPQNLIEKILRSKIYNHAYWKVPFCCFTRLASLLFLPLPRWESFTRASCRCPPTYRSCDMCRSTALG